MTEVGSQIVIDFVEMRQEKEKENKENEDNKENKDSKKIEISKGAPKKKD